MRRGKADGGKGVEELRRRLAARRAADAGEGAANMESAFGAEGAGSGIEALRRRLEVRKEDGPGDSGARDVPEDRLRIPWKASGALVLAAALVITGAWAWSLRPRGGPGPAGTPRQEAGQEAGQETGLDDRAPGQEGTGQDAQEGRDGTYAAVFATEVFDALRDSAAAAEEAYLGRSVELSGYLRNVDSGGKYVFVGADPDEWSYSLDSVRCDITDGAQLDKVLAMAAGDPVTVRGRVIGVGEVLGCVMEIDEVV